jgi:anaerobic magnesium-protoporphyrin IX monomethyl ester cyclase
MKVLFLKPPAEKIGQNVVRDFVYGCWCNGRRIGGMQMPPLNEIYCATHVRGGGVETQFLDAQSTPEPYQALLKSGFAGIQAVVLMSSTQSFRQDLEVLTTIKNLSPTLHTILFGSHPTFMPSYCLREEVVDFIVRREPEETLRCLLQALSCGESWEDLPGIGYRAPDGTIRLNPDRPFMDLNALPIPDRTLLPQGVDYFNPVVKRMPYATMQTSRGCPGRCIFCTAPIFYGRRYRYRSAAKVMEELCEIKRLGYREVFIRDETFTTNKNRNREICAAMMARNLGLSWIANGRVDMVDRETLHLMHRAGCHLIKFGVETGSDEILRNYKKGITTAQTAEAFRWAHEAGLDTHAHLVIGGPGETPETIENTIKFVKKLNPTTASFGILTPYPGTELFDLVAAKHPEIRDGSDSTMTNLHTEGFYSESICGMMGQELSQAVVRAYRKFYFRPQYLLKRLVGIRSFEELMILTVAGTNIFQFSLSGNK